MRFRLRSLFVVMTIVAIPCGIVAWVRSLYYVQVRTLDSVLADFPEIGRVWLSTNDDVTLEVEQVYFSIVNQPELTYGIEETDGASKSEICTLLERALQERRPVKLPAHVTPYRR
jgi:hypothetical protein